MFRVAQIPEPALGAEMGLILTKTMETVVLFRPTGETELALIRDSGWRAFPPRLPEQPIFYPVLDEEYARYRSLGIGTLAMAVKGSF